MSHTHCPKCGKLKKEQFNHHRHHDFHHNHHDHHDCCHHDHHNHHHNHHDFHHRDVICDRFLCDDDFRLRLGGLQGGMNFRLRQLLGSNVKLALENEKKITAKICFVGSDFVEAEVMEEKKKKAEVNIKNAPDKKKRKHKKKGKGKAIILPFSSIKSIELKDDCKDCI
jgi:hypothetical protein